MPISPHYQFEVLVDLPEVALVELPDGLPLLRVHDLPPVLEEVGVEHLLLGVVVVKHAAVERRHLLRRLRKLHHLENNRV